jgi:peroxiredoxin (alkyl hydroperoxide reductase subunit C)
MKASELIDLLHTSAEGVAHHATFVIDPDNVIQHITVNALVDHHPAETLRVLDALQADEQRYCCYRDASSRDGGGVLP